MAGSLGTEIYYFKIVTWLLMRNPIMGQTGEIGRCRETGSLLWQRASISSCTISYTLLQHFYNKLGSGQFYQPYF
ncbi:hypothetical protein KC19_12G164300 [Ceratodon purpureus]|uniref:Uncharacterized protein n=1 Tax=Ceratodon purpureus TaxID=3225 RepID=A0A8T0G9E1_CERPU|nr:hypothetical protein KC19_12G164300 [Ceratodon purpureus]